MQKEKIVVTEEYKKCIKSIKKGKKFVFVSGKAGVGKSVLIRFLRHKLRNKKIMFAAPTGIAAINIDGQTVHSLFGFPSVPITSSAIKLPKAGGRELFKNLDILILDEISMTRADLLDGIDMFLRRCRQNSEPFGGVQIVAVGDLFQLPPVVFGDEEKLFFSKNYESEFFFHAKCMKNIEITPIILNNVFRQSDEKTIEALNKIRVNKDHRDSVAYINRNCYGINREFAFIPRDITLTTTNKTADRINKFELNKIQGQKFTYKAEITGNFKSKLATPEILDLKVGCKIMFTKNHDEYVNGTLGEIVRLTKNSIRVKISKSGKIIDVHKATWENKKYQLGLEDEIEQITIGKFEQYPLTLAWAITIHKSQGLTLENMRIDFGTGAFAAGQVYVALSRCKDLSSLSLTRPIRMSEITVDQRVVKFYEELEELLEVA